jgi:cytochrome c oxidase cbb3-type subunit 3
MSSRCRERTAAAALLVAVALAAFGAAGCKRETRRFREVPPTGADVAAVAATGKNPYEENAWAVSEGQRFFDAYNCSGCHAHGGGGMGPALMDTVWLYGSEPKQVAASIVEGRPNGMPAFRDRIPEPQVWQLVAYVRSLSGLQPKPPVTSARPDHMQYRQQELPTASQRRAADR